METPIQNDSISNICREREALPVLLCREVRNVPQKVHNKVNIEIKPAMRVSLTVELKNDIDGMRNVLTLSSVVEEILDDGCLLIQMPIHQGYHYPLPRDETLLMHFFIESVIYALPVQFLERIERGRFQFAKIRRVGKIAPHQRRDCYRFPCSLPVSVERLWIKERDRHPEHLPTEGCMINFSDGGMLFATDEDIEKSEKITLTFNMGQTTETVEGMALRTERVEEGKYLFRVAVKFRITDKTQKQRFYRHIVDMQLAERRRWTQDIQPLYTPEKDRGDFGR